MIDTFEYLSIYLAIRNSLHPSLCQAVYGPFFMFYRIFNRFLCLGSSYVTYSCHSFKYFIIYPIEYLSIHLGIRFFLPTSLCQALYVLFFLCSFLFFYRFSCLISSYVTGFICFSFKVFKKYFLFSFNISNHKTFLACLIMLGFIWPFFLIFYLIFLPIFMPNLKLFYRLYLLFF